MGKGSLKLSDSVAVENQYNDKQISEINELFKSLEITFESSKFLFDSEVVPYAFLLLDILWAKAVFF